MTAQDKPQKKHSRQETGPQGQPDPASQTGGLTFFLCRAADLGQPAPTRHSAIKLSNCTRHLTYLAAGRGIIRFHLQYGQVGPHCLAQFPLPGEALGPAQAIL
jgi:hypothetical protein